MSGLSLSMFLDRAAQLYADRNATRFHERALSWRELADSVARLAGGLARRGVGRGDRIAILAHNSDRYFLLFFAAWRIGAAVVPLNTRWAAEEIRFAVEDSEPALIVVDDAFAGLLNAAGATGIDQIYMGDGAAPAAMTALVDLMTGDPIDDVGAGGDDMAGIFFTGGTTGRPKGAMLSHQGLAISILASGLTAVTSVPPRILTVLPLFHLSGAQQAIGAAVWGASVRICATFSVEEVLHFIEREQITQLSLVPAMWGMVLSHPKFCDHDTSSLQAAMYGAAPMQEGVLRAAMRTLPAAGFAQGYGQTETSGIVTLLRPEDHDPDGPHPERLRSCGQTLPFAQIRITDPDGKEAPRGAVGEIWVRGPQLMLGYWRRPEETAETLVDGWVRTGDAAYMDTDGYVFIVDRVKDMIISGGENIFSAEVESALSLHRSVAECAVVAAPDPKWGEKVVAIVRLKPGAEASQDELIAFCRDHIAGYKCPRMIVFREAPFPLSAAGKVLKRELRAPFWEGQDRSVN